MMKVVQISCLLIVLLLVQLACSLPAGQTVTETPVQVVTTPAPTETGQPPTETSQPPTQSPASIFSLDMLKNFTYHVADYNVDLTLVDGVYEGGQFHSRLVEPVAIGDVNGDGKEDAVVILATNGGGSGTFFDLIVLLDQGGAPVQSGYSGIGDRQMIKNLTLDSGRIILDFITHGLNDPSCCPSEHRLRVYRFENGELKLAGEQVLASPDEQATPMPNEIIIDQPPGLNAIFTKPQQISGRVSQVPPEMKLAYYVTDLQATLLAQGEVPVEGAAGGPGTFAFEFSLENVQPGIVQVEVVDTANGILRGRTIVVLVTH